MTSGGRCIPVALLASACVMTPHGFIQPEGPYGVALAAATRYASVLGNADEIIEVIATRETSAFCAARTQRMALAVGVPERDAPLYGGDVTEPLAGVVFFLAVHTADASANDLDSPSTRWSLRLLAPQGSVGPAEIVRVHSRAEAIQVFYPYVGKGYDFYRIAFPAMPGAAQGPVTLTISGARNNLRLSFPPASQAPFDSTPESR